MTVKTLNTLIKIHKQKADFLRREMVALEEELHQLQQLAQRLKREHEQEMKMVKDNPESAKFFGSYSAYVKKKITSISEETARLAEAIEEKRTAISEEFSEQKKFEIAQEDMKKQMQAEERYRQQGRFDEIANQQFQKLQENQS